MVAQQTAKEEVHRIVDEMSEEEAADLLDFLNMLADPDELDPEEMKAVEAAIARMEKGEYFTREQLRQKYGM